MAREESDREDLIREATGLIDRVEYDVDFVDEPVVVGFRRDGSISFFFGQPRVYQFNKENELRRGYLNGHLLKAERGRLVRLTRNRTDDQVQLLRHELSNDEQSDFVAGAIAHIKKLAQQAQVSRVRILRAVSSDLASSSAPERVAKWLNDWDGDIRIASTPRLSRSNSTTP